MNATASDRRLDEKQLRELDAPRGMNMVRPSKVCARLSSVCGHSFVVVDFRVAVCMDTW